MAAERPGDARLYVEDDMAAVEVVPVAGGQAAVFTARCPDSEATNEDAAAVVPLDARRAVLVVADGVGGLPAGAHASRLAVSSLCEALEGAEPDAPSLRGAILDGFEKANLAVKALGAGAATTLAVVELQDGRMRPYHVGDSMILVVGGRGKVKLQTVSHSPVGFAEAAGVIDESDALLHEDRHLVSNVLGAPDMRIEMGSARKLAQRDTVLLASDGLFDNLSRDEIATRLNKGPLADAAHALAWDARRRMNEPTEGHPSKPDDLTFVAFRGAR